MGLELQSRRARQGVMMGVVRVFDVRLCPIGPMFFDGFYREFEADTSGWRDGQRVNMTIYRAAQPICFELGRGAAPDAGFHQEVWRVYRSRGEWFACVEITARPPPPAPKADIRLSTALTLAGLVIAVLVGFAYFNT